MIQRIQSVWLLLASAGSLLPLKFSFYSGNILNPDNTKKFEYLTAMSRIPLLLIAFLLGLLCLGIIFLYKNRKLQIKLIFLAIVLSIGQILLFLKYSAQFVANEGNYDLAAILILLVPIFLLLAARGVYKDEKLIKSLDRLR
jgi:glucan phosphoethanolaminetransferase (alkaline phosphatase superfamily)